MTQTQVPQQAQGYAFQGDTSLDSMLDEMVRELRWPANVRVYKRMETDAQISSVLQAVMAPIIRTGWSVDGSGGVGQEVTESISSNLGLPVKGQNPNANAGARLRGRGRFSWNQHLVEALTFLPIGHAVFEQEYYEWDDANPGWRLRRLGYRPPSTLTKFNIADDGGLVSIEQAARTYAGNVTSLTTGNREMPISQLVVYAHGRVGANWRGRSVLRACYKNWLLKDDGNRSWAIGVQRNSMGIPVHTAGGDSPAEVAEGLKIASRARAGDSSGVSLAKGATFALMGVDGTLVDPDKFVRYQDEQIARAVLAHFLNLGTQTGSWALGSTFADFFTLSLQAIAEEIRDVATKHIVEDLVDLNFGETVPAPRIFFDEIGSRRGDVTEALDEVRQQAGLEDDGDMADFIRKHVDPTAA